MEKIYIFDTTLRDGEQCPGASLNITEKIEIAKALEALKVDVIEAGFPISSPGDFEAVKKVSELITEATIAGLARAIEKDIDACVEALKPAKKKRVHIFLATSDIHLKYKLKMSREEVLETAAKAIKYAKKFGIEVEFSAEDASRSDFAFLCQVVETAIESGASVINIPDTVGYALPVEYGNLILSLKNSVSNIDKAILSVHCHNDLGLGVANSLAAVASGARQIECTINGLGERAGNAALEEIVMAIKTRQGSFTATTNIDTKKIYKTSRLVSNLTGLSLQRNKAIVGLNAFAHESGIHQHGVLENPLTYEIMTPESIGLEQNSLVLGKHSGRHAFIDKLKKMGYDFESEKINDMFAKFKELCDKKKEIFDEDIEALIDEEMIDKNQNILKLLYFNVMSGDHAIPTATVKLSKKITDSGDEILQEAACGDGPIDAIYRAVDKILGLSVKLEDYKIRAISVGKDALGEVSVKISDQTKTVFGKGVSTDIVEASLKAYIDAMNKIL